MNPMTLEAQSSGWDGVPRGGAEGMELGSQVATTGFARPTNAVGQQPDVGARNGYNHRLEFVASSTDWLQNGVRWMREAWSATRGPLGSREMFFGASRGQARMAGPLPGSPQQSSTWSNSPMSGSPPHPGQLPIPTSWSGDGSHPGSSHAPLFNQQQLLATQASQQAYPLLYGPPYPEVLGHGGQPKAGSSAGSDLQAEVRKQVEDARTARSNAGIHGGESGSEGDEADTGWHGWAS